MTTDKKWYEDERAIELKCWAKSGCSEEMLVTFLGFRNGVFHTDEGLGTACRLAQGEKTPYDGKGQPVPDGVLVRCWMFGSPFHTTNLAKDIDWRQRWEYGGVVKYQVQEMPEEKTQLQLMDEAIAQGKAIPLNFNDSAVTTTIKQSTIDTAIKLLEDSKANYSDIKALIESNGDDATQCLVEIATIDKLIKELKDK